jgi:catalase
MVEPKRARIVGAYAVIALTLVIVTGSFAWVAGWIWWPGTQRTLTAPMLINAFEADTRPHPGFRRNHAKGVCISGHFESNGNGVALSRASVFERGNMPVIGRLSAPGGDPSQEDANAPVRSIALRFSLSDGQQWRTAMNSSPMFPVGTPQAFYDQLVALRPDPKTSRPSAEKMNVFLAKHPETQAFHEWLRNHPASSTFYNASYFSINAFRFIDEDGASRFVRWSLVPEAAYAPAASSTAQDPDFLSHDLSERLRTGPVRWHLMLTPAGLGDPVNDATRVWPQEREAHRVDAGIIVISQAESQIDGACRDINFDPLILPDGIAPSDDPLLAARSGAYAVSFDRRTREEARSGIGGR